MGGGTPALQGAERSGDEWHIELRTQDDVRGALSALAAADVPVATFEHVKPSLHQIFVNRSGRRTSPPGARRCPVHDVLLIIKREFNERVASRSFIIGMLVFPGVRDGGRGRDERAGSAVGAVHRAPR